MQIKPHVVPTSHTVFHSIMSCATGNVTKCFLSLHCLKPKIKMIINVVVTMMKLIITRIIITPNS